MRGLVALVLAGLLGVFVSVGTVSYSRAQTAAPAAAPQTPAAAPAPAEAAPAGLRRPIADPKKAVTEKCMPNSGDTAWMLTSVALVLMMTIPGLGLFYGGMVRKKNVGDTVMTSFAITCLVTHPLGVSPTASRSAPARRSSAASIERSCKDRQRHRQGHRQSQSAGADDPRNRLHLLPDDLRDHHAGADRRRLRRAHEVLGDAVVHRPVGDLRLRAGRPLGLGSGRLPRRRQLRRHDQGARLRRRHGRAHQLRRRRPDVLRSCSASARTPAPATTWC